MTNHLPEIASRMLNTTLLLHPQKAQVLLWVLGPRIGISEQALPDVESQPDASRFVGHYLSIYIHCWSICAHMNRTGRACTPARFLF